MLDGEPGDAAAPDQSRPAVDWPALELLTMCALPRPDSALRAPTRHRAAFGGLGSELL